MANTVHPKAREEFLGGDLDWDAHDFKLALLPTGYTSTDFLADGFLSDLTATVTPIATSANLAGKTKVDGYANATDVNFPLVAGGSTVKSMALYRDTGVASTSRLVYFADTSSTGVPIDYDTDGNDIDVVWSASGIFRL
jgi:hypothetical protein